MVSLREAALADAGDLAPLVTALGYPCTPAEVAGRLAALRGDPGTSVLVAVEGAGRVLGLVQVQASLAIEREAHAYVEALVVAPGARRRGIGRALLASAEAWARARGLGEILLHSNLERPEAHAFYRALGYASPGAGRLFVRRLDG